MTMRFNLTIKCDNAAFYDDDPSEAPNDRLLDPALYAEVARIMQAIRFDCRGAGTLFDVNGNKVGTWAFHDD
jgi:hypothetical protein